MPILWLKYLRKVKRKPQKANLSSRKRNKKQLHERLEAYKKHIKKPL